MADETINAPATEDNAAKVETTTEETTTDGASTEQTIEEMAGTVEATPEKRVVDEHVFVAEKKARKQAEKDLAALRASIANGATQEEISDDINAISEEYDIDPTFLVKFAKSIEAQTEKRLGAKIDTKLGEKDRTDKFESAFTASFKQAIERGPEFEAIANIEVIKTLAKLPQNSKKTVSQLLEETYGNALTGRRTIETTTPGGGKDPDPLDYDRAQTDLAYYNKVMADPKLKEQYNNRMVYGKKRG